MHIGLVCSSKLHIFISIYCSIKSMSVICVISDGEIVVGQVKSAKYSIARLGTSKAYVCPQGTNEVMADELLHCVTIFL